jgi:hypothetical protein
MPTSPKVPAIGDEADFPPLPPASLSPAPTELSAEAKLLAQIAAQQIAFEKRIELILEQNKLQQTLLESRVTLLEKENVLLKETIASPPIGEDIGNDLENFVNCAEFKDRIAPGRDVHPPITSSVCPQLFDLHQDKTFAAITSSGKHNAARTFGKSKTDATGAHPKPEKVRFKEKPGAYPKGPGPSGTKKES